ncbi:hypothetical protein A1F94_012538 [Pyrenophora tritici-repentis]|nr:hypothetical protein A1F94_012538 [Pyrenophora tritici-repentis]KAI1578733.1 hypothetical protein PtrEW7m1_005516 [Pyrenophora tritici-repentis]PWO25012.1 hypothetical protein PtrARCrB10_06475 [Pyrenophora tritici-repentis]PZD27399.1 hypothetical protein A1F96_06800 [Pyrenophora tritici-repentis]PZD33210.1 hypothetical protein A1F97_09340 [Pyrenophora tritici-repentis]
MPSSNAWLDYPVFEHAWSKQELATEQDTANLRANDSAMTMESEKYFNCPLSRQRDTPPESPKYIEMQSSPMSSPISVYSSTPMVHQQSLDSELRILNAELAKCQMTRDALARREAALLEMKAEPNPPPSPKMSHNTPTTLLKLAADLSKLSTDLAAAGATLAAAAATLEQEAATVAWANAQRWGVDVQVAVRAGPGAK